MVRRHLHMSVGEWRALPWWQTRLYRELMDEEFAAPTTEIGPDGEMVEIVPAEAVGIVWS